MAKTKNNGGIKEAVRKLIVSLKRNPSVIPLVVLFVTFLYYSLNLTNMSDTTAKIQGMGMGLSQFCIMLFSLLSLVCMLNAFPRRQKPNYLMIGLMVLQRDHGRTRRSLPRFFGSNRRSILSAGRCAAPRPSSTFSSASLFSFRDSL